MVLLAAISACGRIGYDATVRSDSGTGGGGAAGVAGTGGGAGSGGGAAGVAGTGGGAGRGGAGGSASAGTTGSAGAGASGTGGSVGTGTGGTTGGGTSGTGGTTGAGGTGGTTGVDGGSCSTAIYGGHTYALCDGPLSWSDAQADCVAKGMRLVRIDDDQENQWVLTNAYANVPASNNMLAVWRWLGASDVAVVGEWRWTDGALFWLGGQNGAIQNGLYANWVAGSPTSTGMATDCAIMQHNMLGFWTDQFCANLQPYVCEQY